MIDILDILGIDPTKVNTDRELDKGLFDPAKYVGLEPRYDAPRNLAEEDRIWNRLVAMGMTADADVR